jgi:hypothetical protein
VSLNWAPTMFRGERSSVTSPIFMPVYATYSVSVDHGRLQGGQ